MLMLGGLLVIGGMILFAIGGTETDEYGECFDKYNSKINDVTCETTDWVYGDEGIALFLIGCFLIGFGLVALFSR